MYVFKFDDDVRKYCEETLNETDASREVALTALKQWAQANPKLNIKLDDRSLISFLRGCKFDLDRTKSKLADYHKLRRDVPEWYTNRDPALPEIQELVKLGVFVPLKQSYNNQLVVIIRTAAHDPAMHKQDNVFKAGNMILDVSTKDNEEAQIYGIVAIFDMKGITLGHARQLTPGIIKKAVTSWQKYHCRPKMLEFINAPLYINVVLSVFKRFMSEKLKGRVRVHYNGLETLHSIIPKEILPKEYGGDAGALEDIVGYWHRKLLDCSGWFEDDEKYRAEAE